MSHRIDKWLSTLGAYGSWAAAIAVTWLRVTDAIDDKWAVVVVVLIGFAVWCTVRLSRMRLIEAMTSVFYAGMRAAEQHKDEPPSA